MCWLKNVEEMRKWSEKAHMIGFWKPNRKKQPIITERLRLIFSLLLFFLFHATLCVSEHILKDIVHHYILAVAFQTWLIHPPIQKWQYLHQAGIKREHKGINELLTEIQQKEKMEKKELEFHTPSIGHQQTYCAQESDHWWYRGGNASGRMRINSCLTSFGNVYSQNVYISIIHAIKLVYILILVTVWL